MSVRNESYVLYGVMVPYDEVEFDDIEDYLPREQKAKDTGVVVIYDGMSGKYVAVGKVIAAADEYSLFEEPVIYGPQADPKHIEEVAAVLEELGLTDKAGPYSFITLTHFR